MFTFDHTPDPADDNDPLGLDALGLGNPMFCDADDDGDGDPGLPWPVAVAHDDECPLFGDNPRRYLAPIDPAGDQHPGYENRPGDHVGWGNAILTHLDVGHKALHHASWTLLDVASNVEGIGAQTIADEMNEIAELAEQLLARINVIGSRVIDGIAGQTTTD